MTRFFPPAVDDDVKLAEEIYDQIRTFVQSQWATPLSPGRIYEIHYSHNGKPRSNRVGERDWQTGAEVFAIFRVGEDGPYLVCTPTRGVTSGSPMIASSDASAVLFE